MNKRSVSILATTLFLAAFALPGHAAHCPADVKAIDHALSKASLSGPEAARRRRGTAQFRQAQGVGRQARRGDAHHIEQYVTGNPIPRLRRGIGRTVDPHSRGDADACPRPDQTAFVRHCRMGAGMITAVPIRGASYASSPGDSEHVEPRPPIEAKDAHGSSAESSDTPNLALRVAPALALCARRRRSPGEVEPRRGGPPGDVHERGRRAISTWSHARGDLGMDEGRTARRRCARSRNTRGSPATASRGLSDARFLQKIHRGSRGRFPSRRDSRG